LYEFNQRFLESCCACAEYYTDEIAFEKHVEEDATAFKPCGKLMYSYSRSLPTKGKGKEATDKNGAPEDQVVYEVYHVCPLFPVLGFIIDRKSRQRGILRASVNIIGECNCLFCSTLKPDPTLSRTRIHGNL
jgi:hypothetical protein